MFGFGNKTCTKCDKEYPKDSRFCPQCGTPTEGTHTDILMVVDRSGSMTSCHPATIQGFNRFLSDQKALPGTASLTVTQFDTQFEVVMDRKPLGEVGLVDATAFVPRGGTALYDAIGQSVALMEGKGDNIDRCVVCIITDGQENSSRECKLEQIRATIARLEAKGWGFIYLAANLEAFAAGQAAGIQYTAQYVPDFAGTEQMYACASSNVQNFRDGGQSLMAQNFVGTLQNLGEQPVSQ